MKQHANPFHRRVRQALRNHAPLQKAWSGLVFRSVLLEFAQPEQILDGEGAMKSGARWNPARAMRALYCSLNHGTAAEESLRLFEAVGLKRMAVRPRLIVGIRCRLRAVVNLAELIGVMPGATVGELLAEEWQKINAQRRETLGQALGRALFDAGVEGLLAPSARVPDAMNLVIFPANLRRSSRLHVLAAAEMKAWLKQ